MDQKTDMTATVSWLKIKSSAEWVLEEDFLTDHNIMGDDNMEYGRYDCFYCGTVS